MNIFCPVKDIQQDHRRNLTIASLLNDVSVEPLSHELVPPWGGPGYAYHPSPSSDTSKSSYSPLSSRSTSPIDLWPTGMSLSKAKRKRILPHQYTRLMEMFEETDTPSSEIRAHLASELDMTNREVQVWFQNRRAKMNRTKVPQRANRNSIAVIYPPVSQSVHPRRASSYIATTASFKATSAIELLASAAEMMRPEI